MSTDRFDPVMKSVSIPMTVLLSLYPYILFDVTIGIFLYPSSMFLRFAVESAPRIMLTRAKESLHVEFILFSLKTAITDVDVVVKCFLLTSLLSMTGAIVG